MVAGGTGGVEKREGPEISLFDVARATWFSKPQGWGYADLHRELSRAKTESANELFQRQLVLGPAPEFCFPEKTSVKLPGAARPRIVFMRNASQ